MSKIEVDAITEQSGTTLTTGGGAGKTVVVDATTVTLGRCGGTVALASGASQTGFGRTGTVDWQTTPKTATFTAVSGEGYFCNTSGGAFTCNLPAGSAGAIVSLADYAGTWQTNNLTVSPNGTDKIGSINADVTLSTEGQSVTLIFVDSTQGWINTMDSTSNVRGSQFFAATVSGTGNTLTTAPCCANVKIAKFIGPGSFCVSSLSCTAPENVVSYLVVAGGGGGASRAAGGGGAGGFREGKSPGAGGAIVISSISATPTAYAGGGGGSSYYGPNPGPGGAGTPTSGTGGPGCGSGGNGGAGVVNTGGAGGAGSTGNPNPANPGCGGAGGSGIVIIRYKFQ
jgi:hypothetical protein